MGIEITSGRRNRTVLSFCEQDAQDQVIEASHDLPGFSFGHVGVIFSQSNVSAIMQAVLDAPIRADLIEQLSRCNFIAPETGETKDDLLLDFTRLSGNAAAFQFEDLLKKGPIQEIFELTIVNQT